MTNETAVKVEWQLPIIFPWLHEGEVHVWRFETQPSDFRYDKMLGLLSREEKERAFRYKFEKDRRQFVMARGALRMVLGGYLNRDPRQVLFLENGYGKPELINGKRVTFNISHSHGVVMMAFTKVSEIGIDVESVQELDYLSLAGRFFAKPEQEMLQALPTSEHLQAFYLCWTRKEALVKAVGEGLSYPLDQFVVSVKPGEPAQLLVINGQNRTWHLWDISELPDYAAALVCDRDDVVIKFWQWEYCIKHQVHRIH